MPRTVLVTRPLAEAQTFKETLEALGYQTILSPLTHIVPLPFAWADHPFPDALVLTSANALGAAPPLLESYPLCPVFCVGEATADSAFAKGFRKVITGSQGIDALIPVIRLALPPQSKILYLRGADVARDIAALLPEYSIDSVITYRAEAAHHFSEEALAAFDTIGILPLFSARAGKILKDLLLQNDLINAVSHINLLCLSAAVLESVKYLPWQSVTLAETPTQESLIEALQTL